MWMDEGQKFIMRKKLLVAPWGQLPLTSASFVILNFCDSGIQSQSHSSCRAWSHC